MGSGVDLRCRQMCLRRRRQHEDRTSCRDGHQLLLVGAFSDAGVVVGMKSVGVSPPGPGSSLQPQAASAAIPDATTDVQRALEALDSLDDYARMACGVDASGPREFLRAFILSRGAVRKSSRAALPLLTRFGRWTAHERTSIQLGSGRTVSAYRCVCDCGIERRVETQSLRTGRSRSCGGCNKGGSREGSLPDRANPARDESPKAIEPDPEGRAQGETT